MKKSSYLTGKVLNGTTLHKVKLSNIVPPHDVSLRDEHTKEILRSLKSKGWIGQPLLGYKFAGKVYSITGSHRIKVAKKLKRKTVPVFVITPRSLKHLINLGFSASGNQDEMIRFFYSNGAFATSKIDCPKHYLKYINLDFDENNI